MHAKLKNDGMRRQSFDVKLRVGSCCWVPIHILSPLKYFLLTHHSIQTKTRRNERTNLSLSGQPFFLVFFYTYSSSPHHHNQQQQFVLTHSTFFISD